MPRDFTLHQAKRLLDVFLNAGYEASTFHDFLVDSRNGDSHSNKTLIVRHDVDRRIHAALTMALLEYDMGIKASFYFRFKPHTFKKDVIEKIAGMGHEIGYHYEVLSKTKGDIERAKKLFEEELHSFRKIAEVKTICMHGSPLSKWDNKKLWEKYDYKNYGLIGEPYLELDYRKILYLTDTGRRWDGNNVSIRDKVNSKYDFNFSTTGEIIEGLKQGLLPEIVFVNMHPNRWNDNLIAWTYELTSQNVKNVIKRILLKGRKN